MMHFHLLWNIFLSAHCGAWKRHISCITLMLNCVDGSIDGQDLNFFADNIWKLGMNLTAGKFLFLGDYVDRGMSGLECLAYLFALKVCAVLYGSLRLSCRMLFFRAYVNGLVIICVCAYSALTMFLRLYCTSSCSISAKMLLDSCKRNVALWCGVLCFR